MAQIMGLKKCMPKYKEVANKKNNFEHIQDDDFKKAKSELIEYIKKDNTIVVRDPCHWTGKFRGACHQQCNIMYRRTYKIPAFFHNFTGYESHHIFKHLSSLEKAPTVIAKSLEKFTSLKIGNIQINDSLQFMGCSMDKLV